MIEVSIYSGFPLNNKDGGGNKYPGLNVNECANRNASHFRYVRP